MNMLNSKCFISIIILVHNAPRYVDITLKSLKKTKGVAHEIIIVDNKSDSRTQRLLLKHLKAGNINKLLMLDENTLFAKGNNIGFKICSKDATHVLLLNSDVEIRHQDWLSVLVKNHKRGATSYGLCANKPLRADGYCFLIDKDLYGDYKLDENFEWWWSVTKLQGQLLSENNNVLAIDNHDNYLYHFGGRSGKSFIGAKGNTTDFEEVNSWFKEKQADILDFQSKDHVSDFSRYKRKLLDMIIN